MRVSIRMAAIVSLLAATAGFAPWLASLRPDSLPRPGRPAASPAATPPAPTLPSAPARMDDRSRAVVGAWVQRPGWARRRTSCVLYWPEVMGKPETEESVKRRKGIRAADAAHGRDALACRGHMVDAAISSGNRRDVWRLCTIATEELLADGEAQRERSRREWRERMDDLLEEMGEVPPGVATEGPRSR